MIIYPQKEIQEEYVSDVATTNWKSEQKQFV